MNDIDQQISDAVMERPAPFRVDGRTFYVYPVTLGKMHLIQRIMSEIKMDAQSLASDTMLAILKTVREHRDKCCALLSYMTARNEYYAVFDIEAFDDRKDVFLKLDDGDVAAMLMQALTFDRTGAFMKHIGLDVEQKNMGKVMKVKSQSDKNTYSFGGLSIYGSLLDVAMERYKMTKRQVVWELDYVSLRLLLADRVNTIYVTDQERKKIHISKDRKKVNGDDREAMIEAINSQTWE